MNRWPVRILGLVLLALFIAIFVHLYNQLATLQKTRQKPAATQTQ